MHPAGDKIRLARRGMAWWITLFPTIFMLAMTLWSLLPNIAPYVKEWKGGKVEIFSHLKFGITTMLIFLTVWLIIEAVITWRDIMRPPGSGESLVGEAEPA